MTKSPYVVDNIVNNGFLIVNWSRKNRQRSLLHQTSK